MTKSEPPVTVEAEVVDSATSSMRNAMRIGQAKLEAARQKPTIVDASNLEPIVDRVLSNIDPIGAELPDVKPSRKKALIRSVLLALYRSGLTIEEWSGE